MRCTRPGNCDIRPSVVFSFAWCVVFLAGCSWSSVPRARIVPAPMPVVSAEHPLPVLPDDSAKLPWVMSETIRLTDEQLIKWAAAREAFWNRDTEQAERLLRELRQDDVVNADHFHDLVLQCYEQS